MQDPRLREANRLRELGEFSRKRREPAAALAAYEEAVALLRSLADTDTLNLAHTLRHLGDVHMEAARPVLAAPHYYDALAMYRAHPDPPPLDLANALRSLAILESQTGAASDAISLWREAGELYALTGISAGVAECERRVQALTIP